MAFGAAYFLMPAFQLKGRFIVVKGCNLPEFISMTTGTIHCSILSELPIMRFGMAVGTACTKRGKALHGFSRVVFWKVARAAGLTLMAAL